MARPAAASVLETGDRAAIGRFIAIGLAHAQERFADLRGKPEPGSKNSFIVRTWPDRTQFVKCRSFVSSKGKDVYECDSTERQGATDFSRIVPFFSTLVADARASLPARCVDSGREENAGASAIYIQTWSCSGNPQAHIILDVEPVYRNGFGNGEKEDPSKMHYSVKMWVSP